MASDIEKVSHPQTGPEDQSPPWWRRGAIPWLVGGLVLALVIAPPVFFVLLSQRYQLVTIRWADLLFVLAVALALQFLLSRGREPFSKPVERLVIPRRQRLAWVGGVIWFGSGLAALLLLVNGTLDRGPPSPFVGTLSRKVCHRSGCSWVLNEPVGSNGSRGVTVSVSYADVDRADEGDSVIIEIMPGFLRRPWIGSYSVRRSRGLKNSLVR